MSLGSLMRTPLTIILPLVNLALLALAVIIARNEIDYLWAAYLWPVRLGTALIVTPIIIGIGAFLIARMIKKRSPLDSLRAFHLTVLVTLVVAFLALFIGPHAYMIGLYSVAEIHNLRIDYSCASDADCVVKPSGCSCCGYTSACMNTGSVEGMCGLTRVHMNCDCLPYQAANCVCVDNLCQSGGTPSYG